MEALKKEYEANALQLQAQCEYANRKLGEQTRDSEQKQSDMKAQYHEDMTKNATVIKDLRVRLQEADTQIIGVSRMRDDASHQLQELRSAHSTLETDMQNFANTCN